MITAALTDFQVGDRVMMHPATDRWMMGDRYGEVVSIGNKWIHVKMDVSRHTVRVTPDLLEHASR